MRAGAELEALLAIAREAAAVVSAVYATPFDVELKGLGDPVTRADREANALICERLAARFPGDAVVAEESAPSDPVEVAALTRQERVFFVDPLDGTREFAARNGEFAVMIGLAVKGRAAAGVVVVPATGEALVGAVAPEAVAFVEDGAGARRPLGVSSTAELAAVRLVVSRSHTPELAGQLAAQLGIREVIPCGSVGVKVARVATGQADLYVHAGGGAKRWDSCAPEAILVAAGGRFTDLDGLPIDYASPDLRLTNGMIASNGALHEIVLAVARERRG